MKDLSLVKYLFCRHRLQIPSKKEDRGRASASLWKWAYKEGVLQSFAARPEICRL
jgi:hypothetical protein